MMVTFALPIASLAKTITSFTLDNGLKIVVIEDHRAPIVTNMIWYKVGAADEPIGKSGIAHFLEHLMFKGTDKMASGEFSRIIAANGGSENAFTNQDYTGYYQRISVDRLPLMMELEANRMQGLTLNEEKVLPERDVIIEERNSRIENSPDALFSEHRNALMYKNHPYRIPVIGWKHEIEKLSRQDALDFYQIYYAPNNAILIVAGDVNPQEVKALAQKYYGVLKPSNTITKRIRPSEPPHRAAIRTIYKDAKVRQPYLIRSYSAQNRKTGNQKEAAALTLFAEIFGGSGVTSFMGKHMQLKNKISTHQSAYYSGLSYDPRSFTLYASPAPDIELDTLEAELDATIQNFFKTGVDEAHLARLKKQIAAAEIFSLDDQFGIARRYGEALTSGLSIKDITDWPDILQSITSQDIMDIARKTLVLKSSVTGWIIPDQEDKK